MSENHLVLDSLRVDPGWVLLGDRMSQVQHQVKVWAEGGENTLYDVIGSGLYL